MPRRRHSDSDHTVRRRSGMTLLELILALALSTFVVYAIGWAMHLHLRSLDLRRTTVEEAQLARALLKMVSDDLRSAVQHREQDFSGVEQTLANALAASAQQLAEAGNMLAELEGTGGSEPEPGGGGGAPGGGAPGGGAPGGGAPGGGAPGGGEPGGEAGGGETEGGETEEVPEEGEEGLEEEAIDYTADIADSGLIPPVVGLYGNATQLQVDISRVPRMDEMMTMTAMMQKSAPPSDIKSVAYYVRANQFGGVSGQLAGGPAGVNFDPFGAQSGLVRRVSNRSSAAFSAASGSGAGGLYVADDEQIVAPEVVDIQFEYFDGFDWTDQWDSMAMGGLPFAVVVQVTLQADNRVNDDEQQEPEFMVFRQVVSIPTAEPIPPELEEDLEEMGVSE